MRTAVLLAAAAAALTLTACNRADDTAADASTEAAEASGAATDTAAAGADGYASGGANAAGGSSGSGGSGGSGETMNPSGSGSVNDGASMPPAQPGDTAGNNVTETERRLNPPAPQ